MSWISKRKDKFYQYLANKAKSTLLYYMVIRAWNLYMAEFPDKSPWEISWDDVTKFLKKK